jgi:transposase
MRISFSIVLKRKTLMKNEVKRMEGSPFPGHPDLETAYDLSQRFVMMLTERRGSDLDGWLMQAKQSGIVELQRFATGIRRDYAAVRSAFSSPWNNGQVEAQVNCLKLQKRLMFGRAKFDLLRLRVLSRA